MAARFQSSTDAQNALTVSELTGQVKNLLEGSFPSVWVSGEISNFARPQSGHCYFSLKDDTAQIRAVIWKGTASRLDFQPTDGMEIVCRGHIDLYAPRGSYQIVIEEAIPKGLGALERALRLLRKKLDDEGLFDPALKKPLPAFPRRIGVVTSPTSAAVRDFLEVLRRRWRGVHVSIFPAKVQGAGAAKEIVQGIRDACRMQPPMDVIVVTRGGGSLEDLWAFNEELVIRAIAKCPIPIVSAIGHEIDVTLSDLVADVRALTPSEAAERVLPAAADVKALIQTYEKRLSLSLRNRVDAHRARLDAIASQRSFRRPFDQLHDLSRRLDEISTRSQTAIGNMLKAKKQILSANAGKLEALSPLSVLGRGYSVTLEETTKKVIRTCNDLAAGDRIVTKFQDGERTSIVE